MLEFGEAGRGLQRRRPRRARQHRGRAADPRAHRPRRVADRARRPTASATTAATRSPRRRPRRLGWRAAVGFDEGIERTVEWYRDNEWWWRPIRSGEYREYYERQYGSQRSADAESGSRPSSTASSLLEPRGPRRRARLPGRDLQRRRLARARGRRRVRPGQPLALGAPGSSAACTSRPSPGRRSSSAACAGGSATSPSTCAATRRPTGSGRATSSTTSTHRQLFVPVGFAHGFCVLSEVADVALQALELLRPRDRGRDRLGRPRRRGRVAARRPAALRARRERPAAGRGRRRAAVLGPAGKPRRTLGVGALAPVLDPTGEPVLVEPVDACRTRSRARSRSPHPVASEDRRADEHLVGRLDGSTRARSRPAKTSRLEDARAPRRGRELATACRAGRRPASTRRPRPAPRAAPRGRRG